MVDSKGAYKKNCEYTTHSSSLIITSADIWEFNTYPTFLLYKAINNNLQVYMYLY